MKKLFFILTFSLLALFIRSAQAQLIMEHSRVELTLEPGVTVVDSMALVNRSQAPMPLTIYWEDFDYLEPFSGKKKFSSQGTSAYSMASWITFSPREVTIPPGSKVDINYTIKVPETASGGYYGVLFFENGLRHKAEGTGVSIVTRVGSLFFIEMADKDKSSAISDMVVGKSGFEGIFENRGNIILFPRGVYYIMDAEGLVVDRGELDKIYLPPAKKADFSVGMPASLAAGSYTLVLTFDLDEGISLVKEVDFSKKADASLEIVEQRN